MKSFILRVIIVLAVAVFLLFLLQLSLTPSLDTNYKFRLTVSPGGDSKDFTFVSRDTGYCNINGRQIEYGHLVKRLEGLKNAELKAILQDGSQWTATITDGKVSIDSASATMVGLLEKINAEAMPVGFVPTKAVTVKDVLAANPPMPTKSRVSFPKFSFEDAFPGDTYSRTIPENIGDDKLIEVKSFSQSPILSGEAEIPSRYVEYLPDPKDLPPVEDRLPINPAVVVGPDSPGRYSPERYWTRVTLSADDWWSKMSAESFVRFDPAGRIQPNLAYRWEIEDSNKVYTFYLRKGHKWSNGKPFTAHDIAFVCNDIIGSNYWGSSPNWMLETNGLATLYPQDVLDWPALKKALTDTENSPLAAHLASLKELSNNGHDSESSVENSASLLESLSKLPDQGQPDRLVIDTVINDLNAIFRFDRFFKAEVFADVDLESDIAAMEEIGYSKLDKQQQFRLYTLMQRNDLRKRALATSTDPDADNYIATVFKPAELSLMNQLLFRASLRGIIAPAKREKVKVEVIDDYVIRFIFPRPNSIFLEKTATYMFYRGLFSMQEEFYAEYVPFGREDLDVIDIYDWQLFTSKLSMAANDNQSTPLGRLWLRMDDQTRKLCQNYPADDDDELEEIIKMRKDIINGVDAALASRDYFDPKAWTSVDLDKRWNDLTSPGMSLLNSRVPRNQAQELMMIRDLIRRYKADPSDLTDQQVLKINTMVLREAFGPAAGITDDIIAVNREAALDKAAQEHPSEYSTWVPRAQRVRSDDRTWKDHVPVISAWLPISKGKDRDFWTVRNPYYYKVDERGQQLPYIDAVLTSKEGEKSNIQLAMAAGTVDCQAREITFENFSFLKSKEKLGNYEIRLWANDYVGEVNFYFSQVHKDPKFRAIFNNKKFRQAMSLGIDRQEIIDIVFHGLSEPAQFSIPDGSPYYSEKLAKAYSEYDPDTANKMLDELGFEKRNNEGIRLFPDSTKTLKLNLDTREWIPMQVLLLVCDQWRKIGVDVVLQIRTGSLINRMLQIGNLDIGTAKEGGNFFAPLQPGPFAPTHEAECPQWQEWVKFMTHYGRTGESPPDWLMRVNRMWTDVIEATSDEAKYAAWQRLCDWLAEDVSRIGICTSPGKLMYVKNDFKNVPEVAMAGWIAHEPANSCPEAFFFAETKEQDENEEKTE